MTSSSGSGPADTGATGAGSDPTPEPLSPPVLYVLLVLADRPLHGYGIMQEVDEQTDGRIRLLPGSLYSTLKRMVDDRIIEECEPPAEGEVDERRRYYRATDAGLAVARVELGRLETVMDLARDRQLEPVQGPGGDR